MIKKALCAVAFTAMTLTTSAIQAKNIDLGFIMDESGSVGSDQYIAAMGALADALEAAIPVSGPDVYTIAVVSFSTEARVVKSATVINSQAALDSVVAAINNDTFDAGWTNYAAALNLLGAQFGTLGDSSMINMMTDGEPNRPIGSALTDATTSAAALETAGWDSLSFESVGNTDGNDLLANLGFGGTTSPLPIYTDVSQVTDPLLAPFVLSLDDFDAYNDVIGEKVRLIVDPDPVPDPVPVPATLPLIGLGLLVLGFAGRRRKAA